MQIMVLLMMQRVKHFWFEIYMDLDTRGGFVHRMMISLIFLVYKELSMQALFWVKEF